MAQRCLFALAGVRAVPLHNCWKTLLERNLRGVPQLIARFGDVRAATERASLEQRTLLKLDTRAECLGDEVREVGDARLGVGAEVVDLAVLAPLEHALEAV